MGLALGVWDELDFTVVAEPGLVVEVEGSGADGVPRDESHLVYRSMVRGLRELGVDVPAGLVMQTRNAVPHGRGMGSSATAIVAGVAAAQGLWAWSRRAAAGSPARPGDELAIDLPAINDLASELEGHPDNASATVFGGMTLSWTDDDGAERGDSTVTIGLALHPELAAVVFVPEATLATHTARALLPERVPLREAALNSARAALLVEAATRRPDLLVPATRDWLHQQARRSSYAASMALVDRLRAQGHAAAISGAGPSVVVLTTNARVEQVSAGGEQSQWRRLVPGIPARGVHVRAR
ncbi:MAG: homoserine kinase [Actinomycetales bacterium]|nr:homoserine kinase [Actinomycetales bacterium]